MLCTYWLLAVVAVYVCGPAVGELCWENSVCSDLSSKDSLLVPICFHLCPSVFLNEYPGLSALVQSSDDESLSLGVLLASLREKLLESNPRARSEERRSSYSMEHFRWGKPAGRKRRPIKVYSLPLDAQDSSKDSYVLQVRRQLGSVEDEGNGDVDLEAQGSITPKPASLLSPQQRNSGTYRMNHFRWGSPAATKRYAVSAKPWEEGSQKPVPKQFRSIIIKDSE